MQAFGRKRATGAVLAALAVLGLAATPASAQLVRRHNDGSISINPLLCFTDYQTRQALAAQGFTDIRLNAPIESQVRAHGVRNGHMYVIDFDICAGGIIDIQRQ